MRKLLIFLVVLIVLVVGVDIGGRAFAESKVGEGVATQTGGVAPSVQIHGFSFLFQVLKGHYSNITLTSQDLTAGPISGIAATIELYDVDFPFGDAVKGDTSKLRAATVAVNAELLASKVAALMPQAGVTISAGANGTIRVSTTMSVGGQAIPVSADLAVTFASGVVHLNATHVVAAGISVPDVAELTKNLSLALPLKNLPFTVQAARLIASGPDLFLTATANDVRLAPTS